MSHDRRQFLASSLALSAGGLLIAPSLARADDRDKAPAAKPADEKKDEKKNESAEEVPATEDLMREHGVLNRVILIYEEGLRRLDTRQEISPALFQRCANLVRKFVEDYHEKLEENFIFPEFEKRGKLVDLTKTLRAQHQAGRDVTDVVLRFSTGNEFVKPDSQRQLVMAVRQFIRMYRPHEAREDTVLFPTFRKIVSAERIKELGDQFEKEEDRLFGDEGFEKTVDQVAEIEKQLGIYELAQFTPVLPPK
jgi:hemerythrin-like domain-containing protein